MKIKYCILLLVLAAPILGGCDKINDIEDEAVRARMAMERTEQMVRQIDEKLDRILQDK